MGFVWVFFEIKKQSQSPAQLQQRDGAGDAEVGRSGHQRVTEEDSTLGLTAG